MLHFADLHIGVENYGRIDPETGLSTRLIDFLGAFDELVDYALSESVDLVILAGDAYKSRDPSQTQQREFAKRLAKLSSSGIPVFLLVGNHDMPHAMGRATALEIFNTLNVPELVVGDHLETHLVTTRNGPIQIVALPWPRRSQLLAQEGIRGMSLGQIQTKVEELLVHGVEEEARKLDCDLPAILTAHVTVSDAKLGSERSMMLGQDHVLLTSSLHLPYFDYVALGHIHKQQIIRETHPKMAYAGSMQRVDFGEEGDSKGFYVINLDPNKPRGSRLVDLSFHKVRARNFVTVNVEVAKDNQDPTQEVVLAISRYHTDDAIVRVRVTLTPDQSVQLRDGDIRDALQDAHFVTSIKRQVTEERRTRLPADAMEGLRPLDALNIYLESRETTPALQKKLLSYAEELMKSQLSGNDV